MHNPDRNQQVPTKEDVVPEAGQTFQRFNAQGSDNQGFDKQAFKDQAFKKSCHLRRVGGC
jgi:hypothetical protein